MKNKKAVKEITAFTLSEYLSTSQIDTHNLSLPFCFKFYSSRNFGKQCIVCPFAHIGSWVKLRATLSNNDTSPFYPLAAKRLDTQTLGIAVSTIFRTSNTFFMSHKSTLLRFFGGHFFLCFFLFLGRRFLYLCF